MNDNTNETPEQSLMSGLSSLMDSRESQPSENTSLNNESEDRGTPDAKQTETATTEPKNQKQVGTEVEKKAPAPASDATQKLPRSEQRKREISDEIRTSNEQLKNINELRRKAEAELAETQKQLEESRKTTQSTAQKDLIPQPQKPKYSREELEQHLGKYERAQDWDMVDAIRAELRAVDKYERDMVVWESRNGEAYRQHHAAINYYRTEIAQKYPELTDPASQHSQVYTKIIKSVPEVLKRPDGELIAAQVTDMYMRASEAGALAKENQELKDKLQALEKKVQPARQTSSTKVGSENGDNPDADFSKKLQEVYGR